MPVHLVLTVLGVSNGASLFLVVYLWGRVRHLEGVVEERQRTALRQAGGAL